MHSSVSGVLSRFHNLWGATQQSTQSKTVHCCCWCLATVMPRYCRLRNTIQQATACLDACDGAADEVCVWSSLKEVCRPVHIGWEVPVGETQRAQAPGCHVGGGLLQLSSQGGVERDGAAISADCPGAPSQNQLCCALHSHAMFVQGHACTCN